MLHMKKNFLLKGLVCSEVLNENILHYFLYLQILPYNIMIIILGIGELYTIALCELMLAINCYNRCSKHSGLTIGSQHND